MVCKNRPDNALAPAITARANGLGLMSCMQCVCRVYAELGPPLYYTTTILFYLKK